MIMEIIWKKIEGYEDLYEVSNTGLVRSLDTMVFKERHGKTHVPAWSSKKGKIIALTDNGRGYLIASLSNKGRKNHYIHRLVAKAFLDNDRNSEQVNHKDANKANNNVSNLEWCSGTENMLHAYSSGLMPEGGEKKNAIKVIDTITFQIFDTIKSAASFYNVKYRLLKERLNRASEPRFDVYKRLSKLDKFCEENPELAKQLELSINRLSI